MTTFQEMFDEFNESPDYADFDSFEEYAAWTAFYNSERPLPQPDDVIDEHEASAQRQNRAQGHKAGE